MPRQWIRSAFLVSCLAVSAARAQQPTQAAPPVVIQTGTQLVALDVTVLDKAGRLVTSGLSRDDFHITEDKQPQSVREFQSPAEHAESGQSRSNDLPTVIFVLDEADSVWLNGDSDIEFFSAEKAYRAQLITFLAGQPKQLPERAEIFVLNHKGLEPLVELTRDRDKLAAAVARHESGLPTTYRDHLEESTDATSTKRSLNALWSLALSLRSLPGRKSVLWLGLGGPTQDPTRMPGQSRDEWEQVNHDITDLLIQSRITLTMLGSGPSREDGGEINAGANQYILHPPTGQYEGDFGFANFIKTSGGTWENGNNISTELQATAGETSAYYTLTYRPENHEYDGKFRNIHVTVTGKGHEGYTVLTKSGYYALRFGGEKTELAQQGTELNIMAQEPLPLSGVHLTVAAIQRYSGSDVVRFTIRVESNDLRWSTVTESKRQEATLTVAGIALSGSSKTLDSRMAQWTLRAPLATADGTAVKAGPGQDTAGEGAAATPHIKSLVPFALKVPRDTQTIRLLVRDGADGRVGSVIVKRAEIDGAPEVASAAPVLQDRPPSPK